MKVLLVEDEAVSQQILCDTIRLWGHEVTVAHNGRQAWEIFQKEPYGVIITDWVMPGMDGLELCRRIRAYQQGVYPYIILLTSKSRRVEYLEGMAAGADDFLIKPVDKEILKARLAVGERIMHLENERIAREQVLEEELSQAAATQRSLLPPTKVILSGLNIYGFLRSSSFVGGDMYNVFALDEKHIGVYFLDVMGHGVPAAFMAVTLHHLLEPFNIENSILIGRNSNGETMIHSPSFVAQKLNMRFSAEKGRFFTFFYGIYDSSERVLTYVRAGAPYPLHFKGDRLEELTEGDVPIGMFKEATYQEHQVELLPGEQFVLASDGLMDWWSTHKNKQQIKSIWDEYKESSPAEFIKTLEQALHQGKPAQDDVSLMILHGKK